LWTNTTYAWYIKSENAEKMEWEFYGPVIKATNIEPVTTCDFITGSSSIGVKAEGSFSGIERGQSGLKYTITDDTKTWTAVDNSTGVWTKDSSNYYYFTYYNDGGTTLSGNTTYYVRANCRNYDGVYGGTTPVYTIVTLPNAPRAPSLGLKYNVSYSSAIGLQLQNETPANPPDTEYAIVTSTHSDFSSYGYVQLNQQVDGVATWATKEDWNDKLWAGGQQGGVQKLLWNTTYYFRVKARNTSGEETEFSSGAAKCTFAEPPYNHVISTTGGVAGRLDIGWQPGDPNAQYRIQLSSVEKVGPDFSYLSTGAAYGWTPDTSWVSGSTYIFEGLEYNRKYYIRVIAKNRAGESPDLSQEINWINEDNKNSCTLAGVPGNITTVNVGYSSCTITWTNNGNPGYTKYQLQTSSDNFVSDAISKSWDKYEVLIATFAWSDGTALIHDTSYKFRVRARNESGVETAYYTTGAGTSTLIQTPSGITVSNRTNSSMHLKARWPGVIPDITNAHFDGTTWEKRPGTGNPLDISVRTTNQEFAWRDEDENDTDAIFSTILLDNATYLFRVKAKNHDYVESGWGESGIVCTRINAPVGVELVEAGTNYYVVRMRQTDNFGNLGAVGLSTAALTITANDNNEIPEPSGIDTSEYTIEAPSTRAL
jgi:hypothetical protein